MGRSATLNFELTCEGHQHPHAKPRRARAGRWVWSRVTVPTWSLHRWGGSKFISGEDLCWLQSPLSAHRRNKSTPFKNLSVRQPSHSYLLTDIRTMTQGSAAAERANTSHLISAAAHRLSESRGDNGALWFWHLGLFWFAFTCLITKNENKTFDAALLRKVLSTTYPVLYKLSVP